MSDTSRSRRVPGLLTLIVVLAVLTAWAGRHDAAAQEEERPELSLRATPRTSFAPARVSAIAELAGGPDDFQEYYCPEVEWDWDDGTTSEASADCDPYEAGQTRIRRRFAAQHQYNERGTYQIRIILKRKGDTLVAASARVQVRPGMRTR